MLPPVHAGAESESDSTAGPAEAIAITESDACAILALASYWFARGADAKSKQLLVHLRKLKAGDEAARSYVDAAKISDASSRPTDGAGSWPALFEARRYQEENVLAKEPRNLDVLLSPIV